MTVSEFETPDGERGKIIACPPPLDLTPGQQLLAEIFGTPCPVCGERTCPTLYTHTD